MIDWSNYLDLSESSKRRILTANLALNKEDVLNALRYDYILINSVYYRTPKYDLLDLLRDDVLSDKSICVELELEEVEL
jgi:hypothetical protein